ncbi:hypothetical protein LSH36_109g05062 [Paralvinella palmiformis]|uniref:RRM domain-containing protein n=1 Tax=Paralvinella palmiformis TaxID=53620 RepID=A0AAD9JYW9_9ANNE|nr:hypothetical protein LSH36_109g05062 [Paralvinella palmiformis]
MSRVIVKNLPKKISEERLRRLFEAAGQITDCSLKYTVDGVFRKFAFIGYRSEPEAAFAVSHFNKTYIDTSCIQLTEDTEFQEFVAVHNSHSTKSLWSNDATVCDQVKEVKLSKGKRSRNSEMKPDTGISTKETTSLEVPVTVDTSTASSKDVSDFEYLKSKVTSYLLNDEESDKESETVSHKLSNPSETDSSDSEVEKEIVSEKEECQFNYIVKMKGLPLNIKQLQITTFFSPIKIKDIKIPHHIKEKKGTRVASVTFLTEKDMEQAMRRNKNCIGQKKIFLHKVKEKIKTTARKQPALWEIKSGRLFIRNLAYCCKEEDLEELFSKYGPLTEVNLPLDGFTKKIKGFAFLTYMMPEHAVKAYTDLDGKVFQVRLTPTPLSVISSLIWLTLL